MSVLSLKVGKYFLVEFIQMFVFRDVGEHADYRNKIGVRIFWETICLQKGVG